MSGEPTGRRRRGFAVVAIVGAKVAVVVAVLHLSSRLALSLGVVHALVLLGVLTAGGAGLFLRHGRRR